MFHPKLVVQILQAILTLGPVMNVQLYSGCGTADSFCVGSGGTAYSINNSGCIKDKDCQALLKISKTSSPSSFDWLFAYRKDTGDHEVSFVFFAISKKVVALIGPTDQYVIGEIPFYFKDVKDFLTPTFCNNVQPKPKCKSIDMVNFIMFGHPQPVEFEDTGYNFNLAHGISGRRLRVPDIGYDVDLINDPLTIAMFHWYKSRDGTGYYKSWSGNFPPTFLFNPTPTPITRKPTVSDKSTTNVMTTKPPTKSVTQGSTVTRSATDPVSNNTDRELAESGTKPKKSLLWLWILLGIIALLIIIGLVICIICGCKKKMDKDREASIDRQMLDHSIVIFKNPDATSTIIKPSTPTSRANNSKSKVAKNRSERRKTSAISNQSAIKGQKNILLSQQPSSKVRARTNSKKASIKYVF